MDFDSGFLPNNKMNLNSISDNQLIIRVPSSRVLKLTARSILLAFVILSFPWIGSFFGNLSSPSSSSGLFSNTHFGSSETYVLPLLFQDLTKEGLLKSGEKSLFFIGGEKTSPQILIDNQMDLISQTDFERQNSIPDDTFDFIFISGHQTAEFIDRTLKIGGIVTFPLSDNPSNTFEKPSNYKIVYLRRFESTFIAMKKTGSIGFPTTTKRKLLSSELEAKKEALNGLESVLLEPPRSSSSFKKYLKRTKFLPDIMGDSLDGYPRRVFIDVGSNDKSTGWFERNYPTRNLDFKKYKIELVNNDETTSPSSSTEFDMEAVQQVGMSDWLRKNVKKEEYVVMKAEAEVVEEMVNSKAISLVDELFMECKHSGGGKNNKNNRRAYWECLALYGRLRDEGVAVHQWWGA